MDSKMLVQEVYPAPQVSKKPMREKLPHPSLPRAQDMGWGCTESSKVVLLGWGRGKQWGGGAPTAWGRRLQLGTRADSGESSHMALMKSTTSLPPSSPGTLQAPADAMPRPDNCFLPSLKGQLLLQLQTPPRPLKDPTERSTWLGRGGALKVAAWPGLCKGKSN